MRHKIVTYKGAIINREMNVPCMTAISGE